MSGKERRIFRVPVDGLTKEQAEKNIKEYIKEYIKKFQDEIDFESDTKIPHSKDYWFPSNVDYYDELTEEEKLHVNMTDDEWKELTTSERKERLLSKEEQDKIFNKSGFVD